MRYVLFLVLAAAYLAVVWWVIKRHWEKETRRILDGVYSGVKVYQTEGPPPPARSPGFATVARQSRPKTPRGQFTE